MKGKYFFGFALILIGVILLIQQTGLFYMGSIWEYWPSMIILFGIMQVSNNKKSLTTGLIVITIGVLLQADVLGWISFWEFLIPLILVIIGFSMIFKKGFGKFGKKTAIEELNISVAFSGVKERISNRNFTGGSISAAFGSVDLDLRNAAISAESAVIDLNVAFGGVDIVVPPNWEIIITGSPIFGDIKNKSYPVFDLNMIKPKLVLNCSVAFGGVEIRS